MDTAHPSFEIMWERIFQKRPTLKTIITLYGDGSVVDYVKTHLVKPTASSERAGELLESLHSIAAARLPDAVVDVLISQLQDNFVVSTVDHHGPLSHPFFLNANFIMATWVQQYVSGPSVVPVLSTASVSLNNSSFPRGFLLHTKKADYDRLALLPSQSSMQPVYSLGPYTLEQASRLAQQIDALDLPTSKKQVLRKVLSEVSSVDPADTRYAEQVTRINYRLWLLLQALWQTQLPDLVTIEQETLVADLLCAHHLGHDTVINEVLCNPLWHETLIKHCSGIQGAFDFGSGYGTFLFWGKEANRHQRVPLYYSDGVIASEDGSISFAPTTDALCAAMSERRLIPSMLLCFIVLNFYYGLECFGGFSQAEYQTAMQAAFVASLEELGQHEESVWVKQRSTANMIEGIGVAFLDTNDAPILATLIDLLIHPLLQGSEHITQTMQQLTLREAMTSFFPEMYPIVTRETSFPDGFGPDIRQYTHPLRSKIQPAARLGNG